MSVPLLKIDLPDVANTAFVTLHCRALESQSAAPILDDPKAEALVASLKLSLERSDLDLHRSLARGEVDEAMQLYVALRSRHFDRYARDFLEANADGTVVNLGCGLDTLRWRLDSDRIIDLDLPEMVGLRTELLRDEAIAYDVLDHRWLALVARRAPGPILFLAEGLFMYLQEECLRDLLLAMTEQFGGSRLVAEVFNSFWLTEARRNEIDSRLSGCLKFGEGARFVSGLEDSADVRNWADGIRLIDEWSFVDEDEPKLGRLAKLRHFPQFRKRQWVVCCELGAGSGL